VNAIVEESGKKTALLNSIRIKIAGVSNPNTIGRSMPGRFYIQKFLKDSVDAGCTVAILEMTSEGARQHRHRGIDMDALVFTNLAREHIESHGSYGAYADAKFSIARQLMRSNKRPRYIVANKDDVESERYLKLPVEHALPFSLSLQEPWSADHHGGTFTFHGSIISVHLPGEFSLKNALAAAVLAHALGIDTPAIARALESVRKIPGRAEEVHAGQAFTVVVDYAHTPDSLQALCDAYGSLPKICILGSAGGGRDTWKRPVMGAIAEKNCAHVILTNDDPYDEDPQKILEEIAGGMHKRPEIIPDRRKAIERALRMAKPGDVVLITGKGIDPLMGPGGAKTPWNDVDVAREELEKLMGEKV
jgi:UDP-N-acetylmuramoyl-L-alanyl-D-glutamate--2,6-diaminopimelate ligase